MPELFQLVSLPEAKGKLAASFKEKQELEKISLLDGLHRVLGEDLKAREDIPAFNRSTVDGYAVKAKDTFGASEALPAYLKLAGQIEMGKEARVEIKKGRAAYIPTGGMLPAEADSVVMIEHTEEFTLDEIAVEKPVAPGENIIFKGDDIKTGEMAIQKGTRLRPQDLGILASLGYTEFKVYKQIKVGIISTGNEVVKPQMKPLPGQVRDINSYTLFGLCKEAYAIPTIYNIVEDNRESLEETVRKALLENDIILLSGGSSVGTRDYTYQVLEKLSSSNMLFHGIPIKPGKPTIAATHHGQLLFGLPGHPVSAMVVFNVLIRPLLLTGSYENQPREVYLEAKLTRNIASATGREDHIRVRIIEKDGELWAEPILGKSGLISTLVKAEGELVISSEKEGYSQGDTVKINLLL